MRESENPIHEALKLCQIFVHRAGLGQLEQGTLGIVIVRGCEARLQSLKEAEPGCDETISEHPLVPTERGTVQVERS